MMARRTLVMLAALISLIPLGSARATGAFVMSAVSLHYLPGDASPTYETPLQIVQGTTLYFAPADALGNHSVTAVAAHEDGTPLFDSGPIIGPGQVAEVKGVATLAPGTYDFVCYVHDTMHGVLQVTP